MPFDYQQLGNRLVQEKVINQAQLDEALRHLQSQDGRLEEILVHLGYVSESTILQFLASEYRTRSVSTERLARARIPQQVLELLPVEIAERHNLIPVLYDPESSTLSIVTADPENETSLREVYTVTRVRELRVYVALQSAVQAAILKHYRGDVNAFQALQQGALGYATPLPGMESGAELSSQFGSLYPNANHESGSQFQMAGQDASASSYAPNASYHAGYAANNYGTPAPGSAQPYAANAYAYAQQYGNQYNYNPYYQSQNPGGYDQSYADQDLTRLGAPYEGSSEATSGGGYLPRPQIVANSVDALTMSKELVMRMESLHGRYANHLAKQELLLRMVMKHMQVSSQDAMHLWQAFYLHHASLPEPHPCLLSLEEDAELAQQTKETFVESFRQFKRWTLPEPTLHILKHLYERVDGKGFPSEFEAEQIPLGARLLAILDSYEELSFREPEMEAEALIERLKSFEDVLFDGSLLELFAKELLRTEKVAKGEIPRILLLDPDAHLTTKLEELLLQRGLWVQACDDFTQAWELCQQHAIDLIVLEADLPGGEDGFAFGERCKQELSPAPELVFLTHRDSQEEVDRGFAMARDYLIKPQNSNLIVAKINKQLQNIEREKKRQQQGKPHVKTGVAGSLSEIGLPELLQVLSQGRRTGKLSIESGDVVGHIYLEQGQVVNAVCGELVGEQAFYKMIGWGDGIFSLDPNTTSDERLIHAPLDGLILDALRIFDEALHEENQEEQRQKREVERAASKEAGDANGEEDFFDFSFDDLDGIEETPGAQQVSVESNMTSGAGGPSTNHAPNNSEMGQVFQDLKEADFDEALFDSSHAKGTGPSES